MTGIADNRVLSPHAIVRIELDRIVPGPHQPRSEFPEASIRRLADSISRCGLLSPLLLRRIGAGRYEIIAGERRYRAMRMLQWTETDAVILRAYDADCAVISLVENLQRQQLHFLEEAAAFRALIETHGFTQETLARLAGRSSSAIANLLRLLKLPDAVLTMLPGSGLTERHARALLALEEPAAALEAAQIASERHMTVRQLEEYIAGCRRRTRRNMQTAPKFRDNRIVINALLDTVRELKRLGIQAEARVQEQDAGIDVIVSIRTDAKKISG